MHNLSKYQSMIWAPAISTGVRLLFLLLLLASGANAQTPFKFNYQGVARDVTGKTITNSAVSVRIQIHEGSENGDVVYQHTYSPVTNGVGIFNLVIGTNSLVTIDWGSNDYFIQTELDADGGANSFIDLGTTQLLSVPYSIAAKQWINNYPVVQTGTIGSGPSLSNVQAGANLIWYPKKGAFRVGSLNANGANYWTENNIGLHSFATGFNTMASGEGSIAMGKLSYASGPHSLTLGSNLIATSDHSFAIGNGSSAESAGAMAFGTQVHATGLESVALGVDALASGKQAVSIGSATNASGENALAMGFHATASGFNSTSIGIGTAAKSIGSFALGSFNDQADAFVALDPQNRIFQVGNGTTDADRSNAMTILRNGNIGVGKGVLVPQFRMDIEGRINLRQLGNASAGVWYSDPANTPTYFLGLMSDAEGGMGFYYQPEQTMVMRVTGGAGQQGVTVYGNVHVLGTALESSDRRLKRNLVSLESSLTKLTRVSGYHYYWKDPKKSTALQTGVVAQELEEVFPELVVTDEHGYKSVNYVGLIPHLVESVKELHKKDEAVAQLQKEVSEMRQMMAEIKGSINKRSQKAEAK
jgi:hypothetical protein